MVNYYFSLSTFDNIDINTKKLEEYLDTADKDESQINYI